MQPNWDYVKKTTLWDYDQLIKKLKLITAYPLIWQTYNHDLRQAAAFARAMFRENDLDAGAYPASVLSAMARLEIAGIRDWGDLLSRVGSRESCLSFLAENPLGFEETIDVLHYLLRWAFPFLTASRELFQPDNAQEMAGYAALKQAKLMNSFDLLEQGHTPAGRCALAERTGLPLAVITGLVHRADIVRVPFVRRKTLLPIYGAGYDSLAKIAAADQAQMESDLDAYFQRTLGKPFENYQSVIVLKWIVGAAQALPVILQG